MREDDLMSCDLENAIDTFLENIAEKYSMVKAEWKADRKNPFKDGRFLAYYEAKEAILKSLDEEESVESAFEVIAELYEKAKKEWMADRRNPFKDGKFLACFEILNMVPAAI